MSYPIPDAALEEHIVLLGKTRSGKSTVLRGLGERVVRKHFPLCVIDPKGDWWGVKLGADGKSDGLPFIIFGGKHADVPIDERAGAHVAEFFTSHNQPCLVDLGGWMPGARTRFYVDFASSLFRHANGKRWLIVDEIHNFAPKGRVMDPDSGKALHWTNRLASEGLGLGIHMIFASQRPQKVHNDTLTSAETLVAMKVLHPSDREAVADWIKGCGDMKLGNEILNSLGQMKRGEGWAWSPEINFGPKRIHFPMFSTYDSFKPQSANDLKGLKGWAPVDLDEVKKQFASYIEKEKADDPKALRARIVELQRENEALAKADGRPSESDLSVAEQDGYERGYNDGSREMDQAWAVQWTARVETFRSSLAPVTHNLFMPMSAPQTSVQKVTRSPAIKPQQPAPRRLPQAPSSRLPSTSNGSGAPLGKAERNILIVLAQKQTAVAVDRVAAIAGYSAKGGGFNNAVYALRSKGYIEPGQPLAITAAGVAAVGSYDPLPTGPDLLAYWTNKVGKAERSILECLAHGRSVMTKEEVASAAGYAPDGGGFNNAIYHLRSMGLISGRGEFELHEDLR